jgi:broad specificity phosphatase PhoE
MRVVASPEPKASTTGQLAAAELGLHVSPVDGVREIDRPALPLMSKPEHERENASIFADLTRPVLGAESGRDALDRFSAAIGAELAQTVADSLVVIAHGTVIALFVAAHNQVDAFELWRELACPSFVVLDVPSLSLREVVANAV